MNFKIIFCALVFSCSLSFLGAQDDFYGDDEYTYYEEQSNRNIFSGGFDFLMPQGDFKQKIGKNSLGGAFSYFRQINYSRFFLGTTITTRRLDSYEILDYQPDIQQSTTVSQFTASFACRIYPELQISILEFFFEGGAGMNAMRGTTNLYDVVTESNFDSFTESIDRKPFAYGGAGFHIPIDESWFLTASVHSHFGTTIDYIAKKEDLSNITETYLAFDFRSSTFSATSISLSLSFLF